MRTLFQKHLRALPLFAAALAVAPAAQASYTYRAELVLVERLVDPESVVEQMAGRLTEPGEAAPKALWVEDANGQRLSDLRLVGENQITLARSAQRLENSGRFRILAKAAWYQSFPPNYRSEPMQVAIGDWLPGAGHREVEGTITIERQRYLHVEVALNHWQPTAAGEQTAIELQNQTAVAEPGAPESAADSSDASADPATDSQTPLAPVAREPQAELLTWIRETRRMRSEEIHFLDSPTIGVLVLFRRIGS